MVSPWQLQPSRGIVRIIQTFGCLSRAWNHLSMPPFLQWGSGSNFDWFRHYPLQKGEHLVTLYVMLLVHKSHVILLSLQADSLYLRRRRKLSYLTHLSFSFICVNQFDFYINNNFKEKYISFPLILYVALWTNIPQPLFQIWQSDIHILQRRLAYINPCRPSVGPHLTQFNDGLSRQHGVRSQL